MIIEGLSHIWHHCQPAHLSLSWGRRVPKKQAKPFVPLDVRDSPSSTEGEESTVADAGDGFSNRYALHRARMTPGQTHIRESKPTWLRDFPELICQHRSGWRSDVKTDPVSLYDATGAVILSSGASPELEGKLASCFTEISICVDDCATCVWSPLSVNIQKVLALAHPRLRKAEALILMFTLERAYITIKQFACTLLASV